LSKILKIFNSIQNDKISNKKVTECPALISLGPAPSSPSFENGNEEKTLWVLLYTQNLGVDKPTSRFDLTQAVVGHFDGRRFLPLFEQEFDFGGHAFAFQAKIIFFLISQKLKKILIFIF
jgi:sucrose-6-phosphate hydrolase SacC (GH32 family)